MIISNFARGKNPSMRGSALADRDLQRGNLGEHHVTEES
jgi:hypothetical protein